MAALGVLGLLGLAVAAGQTRAGAASVGNVQTYTDPAGDIRTAPDITTVEVSHDDVGLITFRIDVANRTQPGEDDIFGVALDVDRSTWTGDSAGFDYLLVKRPDECAATHWSGGEVDAVGVPSLTCDNTGAQASFSANRSDLEGTKGFYFVVLSLESLSDVDFAPDVGTPLWNYDVEPGTAPAEPPPVVPGAGTPAPSPSEATLLRPNGTIAFEREGALWTMNADGSGQHQLATKTRRNQMPSWSPDGMWVAYLNDPRTEPSGLSSGPVDLYVIQRDGSGRHRLARNAAPDYQPVWSPDGTRIAYVGGGKYGFLGVEDPDIYIANVSRPRVTRLTTNPATGDDPAWSPDGKRIAFAGKRAGRNGIFVMSANGRNVKRLTSNTAFFDYGPVWSPNGTRIAFVSRVRAAEGDYLDEIDVISPDGSHRIRFPHLKSPRIAFPPAWSPDGKRLVFQSGYVSMMFGSGYDLYVANADGTGTRHIAPGGDADVHAVWSPDGKWVYFLSNRDTKDDDGCHDLYVAGVDSSVVRRLTTSIERDGALAESGIDGFALTPRVQAPGAGATAVAQIDLAGTVARLAGPAGIPAVAGWRALGPENMKVSMLTLDPKGVAVYAGGYQRTSSAPGSIVDGLFRGEAGSGGWARLTDDSMGEPISLAVDPVHPLDLFLVTDYALETHLHRSSDGGRTWQELVSPADDLQALTIDPRAPKTVYALSTWKGLYRTTNGGESWARIAPQIRAEGSILGGHAVLAVDPTDSKTVYAGGKGLYRSTNGGASWSRIRAGVISALAFDRRHPSTLYAAVAPDEFDFAVLRSADGGRTWTNMSQGVGVSEGDHAQGLDLDFDRLAVDPGNGAIYASAGNTLKGESTIFKSTNDGRTWKRVAWLKAKRPGDSDLRLTFSGLAVSRDGRVIAGTDGAGVYVCESCKSVVSPPPKAPPKPNATVTAAKGLERRWVRGFVADPAKPLVLYAATGDAGLFKSGNGGRSWSPLARPLGRSILVAVAVSRADPSRLYAVVSTGKRKGQRDPTFQGTPARSDDGGKTWRSIGAGLPSEAATAIALLPGRPETILAGTADGGVYRSVDGGRSWHRSTTFPAPSADYAGPGVSTIAVDPRNTRLLYAGTYWGAVHGSTDGGRHWHELALGQSGHADVRQIVVDPFDSRTVWAGVWKGSSPGKGGVFRSGDRGRNWSLVSPAMPDDVQSLQVDPGRRGCLYAGTWDAGLYFTTSAGASWRFLRPPVPNRNIESLLAGQGGRVLVGTTRGAYVVSLR